MRKSSSTDTLEQKAQNGPAISARKIERRYGNRKALRKVTFDLPRGATLVIFGANGAGKTTLLRMLATLERPTAGDLRMFGLDPKEEGEAVRARLGFISHMPMLYVDLSARENLLLFAKLYGVENPEQRVDEMLEFVKLTYRRDDPVRGFSRGMMQRMSIARALIHDPELVLLDEPYSGLDPHATAMAESLFKAEPGKHTIVMTSHDLERGYEAATHLLLLCRGTQVLFAPKEDISFADFQTAYNQQLQKGNA